MWPCKDHARMSIEDLPQGSEYLGLLILEGDTVEPDSYMTGTTLGRNITKRRCYC